MQIHGIGSSISKSAYELNAIWSHLPEWERVEQIEAHLECEGFCQNDIALAIEDLGLGGYGEFEIVSVSCS